MSSIDGREKVEEDKVDDNDESTHEEENENNICGHTVQYVCTMY